jgi:hypothetical protein
VEGKLSAFLSSVTSLPYNVSLEDSNRKERPVRGERAALGRPAALDKSNQATARPLSPTFMFSQLRKHENGRSFSAPLRTLGHSGGLHKSGKRIENPAYLARVLESVSGLRSYGLISHHLGEPQRPKNVAGSRHASANGASDLARAHLFALRQPTDDGEGGGIAEQPAQPRLPVVDLFHRTEVYHVFAIAKT